MLEKLRQADEEKGTPEAITEALRKMAEYHLKCGQPGATNENDELT
ncbi:MAG: hypothetical protein WD066_00110 [Planctomycetaceae bacterium]